MEEITTDIRLVVQEAQPLTWMFWRKRRYIVVLLAFLGYVVNYSLRVNLSVAIVDMTKNRTVHYEDGTVGYEQHFNWTSQDRGLILSSFFWGYIFTQIIGGILARRFGGNVVFGIGIGVTAILTLLIPWLGSTVIAMIVIRVVQGLFEGFTFPCIHDIWLYWAPIPERSRMAAIAYSGMLIGTVLTMPASALLATSLGWKSVFYVFGALGVAWHILWVAVVRSSPEKDRFISMDELNYIRSTVSIAVEKKENIPWKAMFLSKPVYAIVTAHTADNWSFYTLLTQMPSFLSDALNYDIESLGLLSALPYLAMSISVSLVGFLSDFLLNKGYLTTAQVRKYFICGAFIIQMLCMLLAGFLIHPVWSIALIIIGIGVGGLTMTSYSINALDIAPTYGSIVLGFSNTVATLPGMISPALTGFLVRNQTAEQWRVVFYIAACVYIFGTIVYWFWCSGGVQSWALPKHNDVGESKCENNTI